MTMKLYTSKAIAGYLDLTERRVRQMRDAGIIEEKAPGLYDLKPTVVRYLRYLRGDGAHDNLNAERAKLTAVKRERAEMELQEAKGELHRGEDIERALSTMLLNFRARIMTMPAKLAPDLAVMTDKSEIYDRLKKETDEALEELSDYNTVFADSGAQVDGKNIKQEV